MLYMRKSYRFVTASLKGFFDQSMPVGVSKLKFIQSSKISLNVKRKK